MRPAVACCDSCAADTSFAFAPMTGVVPEAHHWVGKQWTQEIEGQNLNFRAHLKRLHRRTICFSKSDEMHEAVIKLYIEQHNRQHQI